MDQSGSIRLIGASRPPEGAWSTRGSFYSVYSEPLDRLLGTPGTGVGTPGVMQRLDMVAAYLDSPTAAPIARDQVLCILTPAGAGPLRLQLYAYRYDAAGQVITTEVGSTVIQVGG